jgi:hypothetical protein
VIFGEPVALPPVTVTCDARPGSRPVRTWTGGWLIHLQAEAQAVRLGPGARSLVEATHYSSEPAAYTVEMAPAETLSRVDSGRITLPPFSMTVLHTLPPPAPAHRAG